MQTHTHERAEKAIFVKIFSLSLYTYMCKEEVSVFDQLVTGLNRLWSVPGCRRLKGQPQKSNMVKIVDNYTFLCRESKKRSDR